MADGQDDHVSLLIQLVGNCLTIVWSSHRSQHIHFLFTFFMAYVAAALEGKNGEELLYNVSFASSHIISEVAPTTPYMSYVLLILLCQKYTI